MFALMVVLSFASLAYLANRKGYHAMGCSGGGGSMAVRRGYRADFVWALMPGRFPPPLVGTAIRTPARYGTRGWH
jgi:hypothetical protein